jgi:hypothetical protein
MFISLLRVSNLGHSVYQKRSPWSAETAWKSEAGCGAREWWGGRGLWIIYTSGQHSYESKKEAMGKVRSMKAEGRNGHTPWISSSLRSPPHYAADGIHAVFFLFPSYFLLSYCSVAGAEGAGENIG